MRKHDVRKWLHAILDLLPVILIPVFMIYSHRHTIDNGSVQVPQNEIVDFNQQLQNGNFESSQDWHVAFASLEITDNNAIVVSSSNNDGTLFNNQLRYVVGHKYYISFYAFSTVSSDLRIGTDLLNSGSSEYQLFNIVSLNTSINRYSFNFVSTFSIIGSGYDLSFRHFVNSNESMTLSNIWVMDLTQAFGVGNEPSSTDIDVWYSNSYYDYTLSHKELLQVGTTTYNDTDIMSQMTYQLYNSVDKYFNMGNVFNLGGVYNWFIFNVMGGNSPIAIYIVWNIVLYEFVMDLLFLLYGLFMWFIDMVEKLMEKPINSVR